MSIDTNVEGLRELPGIVFELQIPQIMPVMSALVFSVLIGLSATWTKAKVTTNLLMEFQQIVLQLSLIHILADVTAKAAAVQGTKECAYAYHDLVVPAMEALRRPADRLEMLVDKELWPMPSYGDLIFEV